MNPWLKKKRNYFQSIYSVSWCLWLSSRGLPRRPPATLITSPSRFCKCLFGITLTCSSFYLPAGSLGSFISFCGSFLPSTPFTVMVFRAGFWVLFSPYPTISPLAISPPPKELMLTTPPNCHLQHRPLPESQTLRFTGYQPSTPGCLPGTTAQHVYSRWWCRRSLTRTR